MIGKMNQRRWKVSGKVPVAVLMISMITTLIVSAIFYFELPNWPLAAPEFLVLFLLCTAAVWAGFAVFARRPGPPDK